MPIKKLESHFVKCNCAGSCSAAEFTKWDEYKDMPEELWISLWKHSTRGDIMPFKERIRWCWEVLRTGRPWSDYISADPEDALKLAEWLQTNFSKK